MKHIPQDNFTAQRATANEYMLALYAEIKADDKANPNDVIPVRVFSLIDRAFARANAGEFK